MNQKLITKISAMVAAVSGAVILTSVIFPFFLYESVSRLKYPKLVSPIIETKGASSTEVDLTRASNWFPGGAKKEEFVTANVSFYTLTIPRLGIEDAVAAIGGEDLSESLIHYPGTALPGKIGNSVIFGHSTLPLFYDPKDYLTIFSTLPTLDIGDVMTVDYDGISYQYRVENMFEVMPTDLQVLDQNSSDSFLTLITCVPPGHPLKPRRLVVRARLVPPSLTAR